MAVITLSGGGGDRAGVRDHSYDNYKNANQRGNKKK